MRKAWSTGMVFLMVTAALTAFVLPMPVGAERARPAETEPNDPANATTATGGAIYTGSIMYNPANDYWDWYRIQVNAGDVINTSLYHVNYDTNQPWLYNLNMAMFFLRGQSLLTLGYAGTENRWESLSAMALETGNYYIAIAANGTLEGQNPPYTTQPANYTFSVSTGPLLTLSGSDSKTIGKDSPRSSNWYKLTLAQKQYANISLVNPGTGDFDLYIYTLWPFPAATGYRDWTYPIQINSSFNTGSGVPDAADVVATSGDYYVYVTAWTGAGQYTLNVNTQNYAGGLDPAGYNNDPANAREITYSQYITSNNFIHQSLDMVDWYKVTVNAGEPVNITILFTQGANLYNLSVFDATQNFIRGQYSTKDGTADKFWDMQDPSPLANPVKTKLDQPGTYYFALRAVRDGAGRIQGKSFDHAYSDYRIDFVYPNHPPKTVGTIADMSIPEGGSTQFNLSAYFTDDDVPDQGKLNFNKATSPALDPHIKISPLPSSTGLVTISTDGIPTEPNWNGQTTVVFTAKDGSGASVSSAPVKITVTPVNDEPFIPEGGGINPITLIEGGPAQDVDLGALFVDNDTTTDTPPDTLTYSIKPGTNPAPAINISIDQEARKMSVGPVNWWFGQRQHITLVATDSHTAKVELPFDVAVTHVNHKPRLVAKDTTLYLDVPENGKNTTLKAGDLFADDDLTMYPWSPAPVDALTYKAEGNLKLRVSIDQQTGVITIESPQDDTTGYTERFTLVAKDNATPPESVSVIVEVNVLDVPDPPTITGMSPNGTATVDESYTKGLLFKATVSDPDTPQPKINWYLDNGTGYGKAIAGAKDKSSYTFVPAYNPPNSAGDYRLKIEVDDGTTKVSYEWSFTVRDINRVPKIVKPGTLQPIALNTGAKSNTTIIGEATDDDADTLTYEWKVSPTTGTGTNRTMGASARLDLKGKDLGKGTYKLTLVVDDGKGGRAEQVVTTITVTDPPKPVQTGGVVPGFEVAILAAAAGMAVALGRRRRA